MMAEVEDTYDGGWGAGLGITPEAVLQKGVARVAHVAGPNVQRRSFLYALAVPRSIAFIRSMSDTVTYIKDKGKKSPALRGARA